jgi:hypothetical protein
MNRLIGIASAMLLALLFIVPVTLAAEPSDHGQRVVITSGTNITLAADESVELFIVYNGSARIEGNANAVLVVNGTVELIGGQAEGLVAIGSRVSLDASSVVSGDIRAYGSTVTGANPTTVLGSVRDVDPNMLLEWRSLGAALLLIYVAFAVSALAAGIVLAGIAGRQVRAATDLIRTEPVTVVGAAFAGLIGLLTVGVIAIVTVVGIPFGIGVLALVMPALFVVGYVVAGIGIGASILAQSAPGVRERPYLAAIVGLSLVGVISIIPPIGGLVSFVGFGAVVLLMWRVARGAPSAVRSASQVPRVTEAAG